MSYVSAKNWTPCSWYRYLKLIVIRADEFKLKTKFNFYIHINTINDIDFYQSMEVQVKIMPHMHTINVNLFSTLTFFILLQNLHMDFQFSTKKNHCYRPVENLFGVYEFAVQDIKNYFNVYVFILFHFTPSHLVNTKPILLYNFV